MQIIMFATRARASMLYTAVVFPTIFCSLVILTIFCTLAQSARFYRRKLQRERPQRSLRPRLAAGAAAERALDLDHLRLHLARRGPEPQRLRDDVRQHLWRGVPRAVVVSGVFRMLQDVAGSAVTSNGNASQPFLPTHLPEQLPDLCGARAGGGLERGCRGRREVRAEGVEGELRILGEGDKLGPNFKNLIGTLSQPAGPTCEFEANPGNFRL